MVSEQQVTVMTGAASGFGKVVAEDLAKKGWKVVILDVRVADGKKIAEAIHGDFIEADVRKWPSLYSAFKQTFEKYGRIDLVFANAGIIDRVDHFEPGNDDFDPEVAPDIFSTEVNFIGSTFTALLGMKYMRKNTPAGGDIIMTSSGSGIYPTPMTPYYCGAKHGVTGFGRALGGRLEGEGIRVNVLVPGMVATNLMPADMWARMDSKWHTPPSHLATAVKDILSKKVSGALCEASIDKLFYRDPIDFPDEAERFIMTNTNGWRKADTKNW